MKQLTTPEIHLLAILLTGELNDYRNVRVARRLRWTSDVHPLLSRDIIIRSKMRGIRDNAGPVAEKVISGLISKGLIKLIPPGDDIKYFCEGVWAINEHMFKKHPQYNEVRAQAALGT